MRCEVRLVSALEKVFPDEEPREYGFSLSTLRRDVVSFQIAYRIEGAENQWGWVAVDSPLAPCVSVREVKLSPSTYPCHPGRKDENYLRTAPGMYPDRLAALGGDGALKLVAGQWRALWVDIEPDGETPAGSFPVTVCVADQGGMEVVRRTVSVEVIDCVLPKGEIYHTEWFHADCLADFYGVATDSEAFFPLIEPFIRLAVRRGVNTILTPLFTPPLDTAEGGERTTVQLVGVRCEDGRYSFDFTRLEEWVAMCERCGVETFEMSHFFSQWGAKYAPKIMGELDGVYTRLFGWETLGNSEAYRAFLDAFLPALREWLVAKGIDRRCLFHISDEPHGEHLPQYREARDMVKKHLGGYPIVDALSDFSLYQSGAVELPIVANNAIEPFLQAGVAPLWTYYCTSQAVDVSNRFFSMPSARNRILGVQLYKFHIAGFLQWGYNFYNTQYSVARIDPYAVTDAGDAFPSGDAFLVYPGPDGVPEESIRMMVIQQAFNDVRALRLLEGLASREEVMGLVEDGTTDPITFSVYPKTPEYLLSLRERINREIAGRIRQ